MFFESFFKIFLRQIFGRYGRLAGCGRTAVGALAVRPSTEILRPFPHPTKRAFISTKTMC
jgi:hypothetical protein